MSIVWFPVGFTERENIELRIRRIICEMREAAHDFSIESEVAVDIGDEAGAERLVSHYQVHIYRYAWKENLSLSDPEKLADTPLKENPALMFWSCGKYVVCVQVCRRSDGAAACCVAAFFIATEDGGILGYIGLVDP